MSSSVSLFWRECAWLLNCCRYCYLSWLCCHRSLLKCCLRSSSAALAHASSCRSVDSLLSLASSSFISAAAPSSDADRPADRWTSSMAAATREATRAVVEESAARFGGTPWTASPRPLAAAASRRRRSPAIFPCPDPAPTAGTAASGSSIRAPSTASSAAKEFATSSNLSPRAGPRRGA